MSQVRYCNVGWGNSVYSAWGVSRSRTVQEDRGQGRKVLNFEVITQIMLYLVSIIKQWLKNSFLNLQMLSRVQLRLPQVLLHALHPKLWLWWKRSGWTRGELSRELWVRLQDTFLCIKLYKVYINFIQMYWEDLQWWLRQGVCPLTTGGGLCIWLRDGLWLRILCPDGRMVTVSPRKMRQGRGVKRSHLD